MDTISEVKGNVTTQNFIEQINANNEKINQNFTKLKEDYIIEQDTKGDWFYRIWASGIVEMWASVSVTTTMTDQLGSTRGRYWGKYFPNPEYPFELYEPNVQFTPYDSHSPTFGIVTAGNYTPPKNKPPLYAPYIFEEQTDSFTFTGRYYVMARIADGDIK